MSSSRALPTIRRTLLTLTRTTPRLLFLGAQLLFLGHLLHDSVLEVAPCVGASMLPTLAMDREWIMVLRPRVAAFVRRIQEVEEQGAVNGKGAWRGLLRRATGNDEGRWERAVDRSCGLGLRLGDLVVTLKPTEPGKSVCKRIVGLAGDTVLLDPGVGGGAVDEDWERGSGSGSGLGRGEGDTKVGGEEGEEDRRGGWDWRDGGLRNGSGATSPKYVTVPKGHIFVVGDNLPMSSDSREYGPVPLGLVQGRVVARVWPNWSWFPKTLRDDGPL